MKPTYDLINFDGGKIAVYDTQKENSTTIFFLHGNSLSASVFEAQFNDEHLNNFRLVAIDLPGHGESEDAKMPSEVYSIKGLTKTVSHIVPQLGIARMMTACFSLGAHIVMQTAETPELFSGAFAFGYPPVSSMEEFSTAVLPTPALPLMFSGAMTDEQAKLAAGELLKGSNQNHHSAIEMMLRRTDPIFRTTMIASVAGGMLLDEKKTISKLKKPLALVRFGSDVFIKAEYYDSLSSVRLWKDKVQVIKNASHCGCIDQHEAFNALLNEYAKEVFS